MNKSVVGWSAGLLALGVPLVFLPAPGPWFAPLFFVAAWGLAIRRPAPAPLLERAPEVTTLLEPLPPSIEVRETLPAGHGEELQRFRASLEILEGLKDLVVKDTETAALRLTEGLFTLVENSKEVSSQIERSLVSISDGDTGLERTVFNLEEQVRVFEALESHFSEVKSRLGTDIDALTTAVKSINQFSGTLSDLADQTNVLAINASIEAARVGVHGKGFAVIANHVQSLAKHSKAISDKMATTIREVVSNVEASFERQTKRILDSEGLIRRSEHELRRWAQQVGPQVTAVQTMINESRQSSALVTEELNQVTVSLQFQDRTRQVLDHMAAVLKDSARRLTETSGLDESVSAEDRQLAFEAASRHFTVEEEWALGKGTRAAERKTVELF